MSKDRYENPLVARYASKEMSYIWSPQKKFSTWRKLWLALAKAEQELDLPISDEQLKAMEGNLENIDFDLAAKYERDLRHDVMAHVHAWGDQIPVAKPIIHLGATSCYVGDNTDLIQIRESLDLVEKKVVKLINVLAKQAKNYKDLATLGFTHFQPAQLTTVGKRCTLWLQDFLIDLEDLRHRIDTLPFRGVKGTTGTQASFLELFEGDHDKVKTLNLRVAELMDFEKVIPVSGQTYTRKIDYLVLSQLSAIAQSTAKMAVDIRLLSNLQEIEEPFESKQIGSSAMPYKRNPMRSERICSIARYVMSLADNGAHTHANQWFERTLDDSANRRLSLPEAFLGVDVVLTLATNVIEGMAVWPHVINKRVMTYLPFMATENIIMACVKAGGDRQDLHEAVRIHSVAAAKVMKEGGENDLLERIANDEIFAAVKDKLDTLTNPADYIGRSSQQVDEFIDEVVLAEVGDVEDVEMDDIIN
ncbi:adenylosuccinate lyase [Lentisphaera araneosa HTCC2155]|uniref:Adenylosuccinate lyase n=1 Tax=Lentisphaera araneosa HTCC2155 TaxID=313628 RepID=A6DKX5_9BACT|nr:adenylosuccinate lyase [Lentisphaera araneosa]EDM27577.1 adenylosuccinate lyase [Lentisphaera araneosa HTCC2155]